MTKILYEFLISPWVLHSPPISPHLTHFTPRSEIPVVVMFQYFTGKPVAAQGNGIENE
jgi:hypothetical protein